MDGQRGGGSTGAFGGVLPFSVKLAGEGIQEKHPTGYTPAMPYPMTEVHQLNPPVISDTRNPPTNGIESILVFDQYPDRGRTLLGIMRGATCRRNYGAEFIRITGQRKCAYCGVELLAKFDSWLTMVLDHVVPVSVCKAMQISNKWCHDYSNAVLSCAACNGFCNRYGPALNGQTCQTLEEFYKIRDQAFQERKHLIEARRTEELEFFKRLSPTTSAAT